MGTLNYMSPEAILGGATNIRGGPPMKVPGTQGLRLHATHALPAVLQSGTRPHSMHAQSARPVPVLLWARPVCD